MTTTNAVILDMTLPAWLTSCSGKINVYPDSRNPLMVCKLIIYPKAQQCSGPKTRGSHKLFAVGTFTHHYPQRVYQKKSIQIKSKLDQVQGEVCFNNETLPSGQRQYGRFIKLRQLKFIILNLGRERFINLDVAATHF